MARPTMRRTDYASHPESAILRLITLRSVLSRRKKFSSATSSEGQDRNWREVANDREVQYSNLPPGDYVFRVTAANNSGVWNEAGAIWSLLSPQPVIKLSWFYASSVLAGLLIAWTIYRIRMRQVARSLRARFDERLSERTRIARDLHDTLLQSFQASLIQMQTARNIFPRRPEEAIQTLDNAIGSAEQAIDEGRDAIQDLRTTVAPQSDLEYLLTIAGQELAKAQDSNGTQPVFGVSVKGTRRSLVAHPSGRGLPDRARGAAKCFPSRASEPHRSRNSCTITVTFACGFATMEKALTGTYWRKVRGPGTGACQESGSARNGLERDSISGVKLGRAPKLS